eukprot:1160464-Pelagomonas_calceolata.AAC.6
MHSLLRITGIMRWHRLIKAATCNSPAFTLLWTGYWVREVLMAGRIGHPSYKDIFYTCRVSICKHESRALALYKCEHQIADATQSLLLGVPASFLHCKKRAALYSPDCVPALSPSSLPFPPAACPFPQQPFPPAAGPFPQQPALS